MTLNRLVVAAAVIYAVPGLAFTFAPAEVLSGFGAAPSPAATWIAQLLGAAFLAIAFMNWMQRFSTIAGILGRPLLVMNLTFALVSFFATFRAWRQGSQSLLGAALVFGLLALGFALRLFVAPSPPQRPVTPD